METKMILQRYKCNNRAEIETNNPKLISIKLNEILSTCEKGRENNRSLHSIKSKQSMVNLLTDN